MSLFTRRGLQACPTVWRNRGFVEAVRKVSGSGWKVVSIQFRRCQSRGEVSPGSPVRPEAGGSGNWS